MSILKIGDRITLGSAHGKYLSIYDYGEVHAGGEAQGPWERLVVLKTDGSNGVTNLNFSMSVCFLNDHGNLITADSNGNMNANTTVPAKSGWWQLINPDNPKDNSPIRAGETVALKSVHGQYLYAEKADNSARTKKTAIGAWEKWRIDHDPNIPSTHIWNGRMIALCSAHGRHVKIDKNHAVHGDALLPGPWERLTVHVQNSNILNYGSQVALRTYHGRYLKAERDGSVKGDAIKIGPWELWTVQHPTNNSVTGVVNIGEPILLRSAHGKYLCAEENHTIVANRANAAAWERFIVHEPDRFKSDSEIIDKIESTIKKVGSLSPNYCNHFQDLVYYCPSVEEAYQIVRKTNVEQPSYKFKDEQFDCDDFAYLLKAEFAKTAYNDNVHNAPWAVGIIFNQSHAYNWMINDDFVMRLIEPQTDKIYYPGAGDIDVNFIAT